MRTCRLVVLAVSLALVCPSGWTRSGESDLPKPPALGATKEQTAIPQTAAGRYTAGPLAV